METPITRVLSIGDSQVVRTPAEFRLNSDLVRVSRNEQGDLVIHPWRADRSAALLDVLGAVGGPRFSLASDIVARSSELRVARRWAGPGAASNL